MRKRYQGDGGFLISYFFNLIFNGEWLAAAVIFIILDVWLGLPSFIWITFLVIFFVWPLIITLFLAGIAKTTKPDTKPRPNKNPYSSKTIDYNINNGDDNLK